MSLDAGSVFTTLGFKVDSANARAYEAQVKKAAVAGEAAESRMAASQGRLQRALGLSSRAQGDAERAAQRAALAQSDQAVAVARNEAEQAKLTRTVRSSGVATKLQAAELGHLTNQHAVLSSALSDATAKTTLWSRNNEKAAKNLGTLGNVAGKGAAIGVLGLAAATIYAAKTAGDFEKQMRNVNSIAKLNEADYHSMSRAVLGLAGETAQAPRVLAEGLYQLVSSGFNASDSLIILKASAKAATAGLTDTATATTAVAAVLNAYRLPATQASNVSDTLFETVNRGVLTFAELSKEIGTVLPFASALGVPLKDVGAAISTMTKEGISAPETMTRIKQAMVSIIKPSKDMKAAIAETGASSGQALIQQKGFQGALEALVKTTGGSKEALSKLFPNIRATGGVLALTGKNARSAAGDIKAFQDTTGATAKVFAEQAKGAEFAGKKLFSSFQTAAIMVGNQVLPILAKGAGELTHVLQQAANDGSLERLGHSILGLFEGIGQVGGDLGPPIEEIAKALVDVGQALGLANPAEVATLAAGFLAFKAATFVAPILAAIAGGMQAVALAAVESSSIVEFGAALAVAAGPAGLFVGAVTLAAGAFVALESGLFSSASAAERNAQALREDKQAMEDLANATKDAANAELDAAQAALDHKAAKKQQAADEKQRRKELAEGNKHPAVTGETLERDALQTRRTALSLTESQAKAVASVKAEEKKLSETGQGTQKRITALTEELAKMDAGLKSSKDRAKVERELAQQQAISAREGREAAIAEVNRLRLSHGKETISQGNAAGVNALQLAASGLPKSVRLKLFLEDQGALSKLGGLSTKLETLNHGQTMVKILSTAPNATVAIEAMEAVLKHVPDSKVIHILHNGADAAQKMRELRAAIGQVPGAKHVQISSNTGPLIGEIRTLQSEIDALHGKEVVNRIITQNSQTNLGTNPAPHGPGAAFGPAPHKAAGGRGAAGETALVGEGAGAEYVINSQTGLGGLVTSPTFMGLGPQDYVVPLEDRYRGRALDLFASLAKDLGVPGYKGGKKPAHRPVPGKLDPLSVPVSDLEGKASAAKSSYEQAASHLKSVGKKATAGDRARVKTDRTAMLNLQREAREAKAFAAKVAHDEAVANTAANEMRLADGHNDERGYQAARAKRGRALSDLQRLIRLQAGHAHGPFLDELREKLTGSELDSQGLGGEAFTEPAALSPADQAREKQLEAAVALAALTPGLGDDTSAAQGLVSFLEGALSSAQARGAGPDAIIELAGQVKSARSNLESLTGSGTNENADVQAQINQANERAALSERTAQIAEQALSVFGGPGDIGAGGSNARGAVININTLHPGDPATLRAIGDAATSGIGLQGSRRAVRQQVGP